METIFSKLPIENTPEHRAQRAKFFRQIDQNGNGYVSLAEVDLGIKSVLKCEEIYKAKPVIMQAFKACTEYGEQL